MPPYPLGVPRPRENRINIFFLIVRAEQLYASHSELSKGAHGCFAQIHFVFTLATAADTTLLIIARCFAERAVKATLMHRGPLCNRAPRTLHVGERRAEYGNARAVWQIFLASRACPMLRCRLPREALCPQDRDVTIMGVRRRAGAEPRCSAARARRPMHQPTKPLPLFDRAYFSTLGS